MTFENPQKKEGDPGYKPLQLEYREGHFYLPDGIRFEPDFEVINDPRRIELFIEYERTFGRGRAFELTHQITKESQNPIIIEKYGGYEILVHFKRFATLVPIITRGGGNIENIKKLTKQLKNFRLQYPLLYEDTDEHTGPGHLY